MLYKEMRRKEIIKNTIYICFILLLAIIPTYFIYYKFQDDRSIESNSENLDVTYLEKTGDKISITKVTPVTDSVGLSSKNYIINIKNNLTEKVGYRIKIEEDLETISKDNCEEKLISHNIPFLIFLNLPFLILSGIYFGSITPLSISINVLDIFSVSSNLILLIFSVSYEIFSFFNSSS